MTRKKDGSDAVVKKFLRQLIEICDDEGCSDKKAARWVEDVKKSGKKVTEAVRLRAAILLGRFGIFKELLKESKKKSSH